MSKIFGGGTSKASKMSVANQQAQNAAAQRFIEQQTGQARRDVGFLFEGGDVARNQGFQSALDMIAAGVDPQISAFQQGNVGAQNVYNQGMNNFQNAILGFAPQQYTPQQIDVNTQFLQGNQLPSSMPQQVAPQPAPTAPQNYNGLLQSLARNGVMR